MESSSVYNKNISTTVDQGLVKVNTTISPGKITRFLLTIIGILSVLCLLGQIAVYIFPGVWIPDIFVTKFYMDAEQNFPSLYSSLALLFSSVLFAIIAVIKTQNQDDYRWYWKGLSFIFLYISLDELLSIHEGLNGPIRKAGASGFLYNTAWVIPAFFLVIIFLFIFYKFFIHLPRYMKRSLLMAMLVYLSGALFIETIVGGAYVRYYGEENIIYALMVMAEEICEMLGVVILIHALITYIIQLGIDQIQLNLNFVKKPELASMNSNKL
ncbi:hypothetical protein [Planktothrix mougeotii]|uniref:Multidrug transporter n=1 Tax=Planktothrix mougeotii LEGE 06226 TaxID=1828728 RepID=A0ABR9UFU7_9CYAN|nr:hypothetical protein [Planktothrix mougeotii]MBE9145318.1 hypothetical protein [Planktothrix mougeotii LEGE 06226]